MLRSRLHYIHNELEIWWSDDEKGCFGEPNFTIWLGEWKTGQQMLGFL